MLNGTTPIFLFQFFKLTPELKESIAKIPIVSSVVDKIGLPPIPLYLDEKLTGLLVNSQTKNIAIETTVESKTDGGKPVPQQKAIGSTVTINMYARADSLGLTLFSVLADLILEKVTSKEYSISYLNGAITVFNGLLHDFSINETPERNLLEIQIVLSRTGSTTKAEAATPAPEKFPGAQDLGQTNRAVEIPNPPLVNGGPRAIKTPLPLPVQKPIPMGGTGGT